MEKAVVKKRRGISPVWILPAVALCIGIFLLYKGMIERPVQVVVHFKSAEGVTAGKTKVIYKGLPVGVVKKIKVDKGLDTVSMYIDIMPEAKNGLVKDLKFWIVRPDIRAGRISGLETIFSGSYIAVQPGKSKIPCYEFWGLDDPPPVPKDAPGLHIKLKTDSLNSLQRGSDIYYRDILVGSIQGYTLQDDGTILIDGYIKPEYKHLVREGSRFWNASGITLVGGIKGLKFRMQSLASLVSGGISFATPDALKDTSEAQNGTVFPLYEDFLAAEYGIEVQLRMENADDITAGITKVTFHGIDIGKVTKLKFNKDDPKYKVTAVLVLDPMTKSILKEGTKFWVIRPRVAAGGVQNLGTLVSGPYITLVPGEGKPCHEFTAQGTNSKEILKGGVKYRLIGRDLFSLQPGSPVIFKHITVGEVQSYHLRPDKKVELVVVIYEDFAHLINSNCVFWNYSGLDIKLTPATLKVKADGIGALLAGGINFDFPEKLYKKGLKPAPEGTTFTLYDNYSTAIRKNPALKKGCRFIKFSADFPVSVGEGSGIYYKNFRIGEVMGLTLVPMRDQIVIEAFIEDDFISLVRPSSKFFINSGVRLKGSIRSGIDFQSGPLATVLAGGIVLYNPPVAQSTTQRSVMKKWPVFRLYQDKQSALEPEQVEITIRFPAAEGLSENAKITASGVKIGTVSHVEALGMNKGMLVKARIIKEFASIFTDDADIWVVKPILSLSRVRNPETLITGPYIAVRPGKGFPVTELVGRSDPPPIPVQITGLHVVVESQSLGSLTIGSPVYYRQIRVGQVAGYELSPDSRKVFIHLDIKQPFAPLIRRGTRFWNVSGIKIDAGLFSGIKVRTESMEAIVGGGISLATPDGEKMGSQVRAGHHFQLYREPRDEWLKWNPLISLSGR